MLVIKYLRRTLNSELFWNVQKFQVAYGILYGSFNFHRKFQRSFKAMAYIKLIFSSTSRSMKKIDRHHQTVHRGGTWKICQRLYMIGQKRELRYQNWIRNMEVKGWWRTMESCWVQYVQRVNAKGLGSRDLRLAPSLLWSLLSCGSWRRVVCQKCTDVPEDDPKRRHTSSRLHDFTFQKETLSAEECCNMCLYVICVCVCVCNICMLG